jgi:hypothetical protein
MTVPPQHRKLSSHDSLDFLKGDLQDEASKVVESLPALSVNRCSDTPIVFSRARRISSVEIQALVPQVWGVIAHHQ